MDTCIAIRIAFKKNGKVFVRSGAGIVADSVPEREYQECENKMRGVLNALEEAQSMGAADSASHAQKWGHKQ
jgi:anthranilate synthase component 1